MINPKTFADNTLMLLQQDPRRYRAFGVYWYFVKAVMQQFYTSDNLHLLGENMDQSIIERMPKHENLNDALAAAIAECRKNATYNVGRNEVEDPVNGGTVTLIDSDAGGL